MILSKENKPLLYKKKKFKIRLKISIFKSIAIKCIQINAHVNIASGNPKMSS